MVHSIGAKLWVGRQSLSRPELPGDGVSMAMTVAPGLGPRPHFSMKMWKDGGPKLAASSGCCTHEQHSLIPGQTCLFEGLVNSVENGLNVGLFLILAIIKARDGRAGASGGCGSDPAGRG